MLRRGCSHCTALLLKLLKHAIGMSLGLEHQQEIGCFTSLEQTSPTLDLPLLDIILDV